MREMVSLHVGNAGVCLGMSCWELYCLEHNLSRSGQSKAKLEYGFDEIPQSFFFETSKGSYHPRAIFLDLDPTEINIIKAGSFRNLFEPDYMISGSEGASNLFSKAKYSNKTEKLCEAVRKLVDDCSGFLGFHIHHSTSGGTGSGATASILLNLCRDYGKKCKLTTSIFPSIFSTTKSSVVDPYNVIFSVSSLIEFSDTTVVYSNDTLSKIANEVVIDREPNYKDLNFIARQHISLSTISQRFESPYNVDITEYQTGLVPYPRLHFLSSGFCPIQSIFETTTSKIPSISSLSENVLLPNFNLSGVDQVNGKYMSCMLIFRGDVNPKDINIAVSKIKNQQQEEKIVNFVDWAPTGFKCGLNNRPTCYTSDDILSCRSSISVGSMSNHTGIGTQLLKPFLDKFDLMMSKRAFVHWFLKDGMEEGEFFEMNEDVRLIIQDLEEVEIESNEDDDYDEEEEEGD